MVSKSIFAELKSTAAKRSAGAPLETLKGYTSFEQSDHSSNSERSLNKSTVERHKEKSGKSKKTKRDKLNLGKNSSTTDPSTSQISSINVSLPVNLVNSNEIMEQDSIPNIAVSNRFAVLAASISAHDLHSTTLASTKKMSPEVNKATLGSASHTYGQQNPAGPTVNNTDSRVPKPPPLYIPNFAYNIAKFERELARDFGKTFSIKYLGNKIPLQFEEINPFKKFRQALNEGNIPYFTFSLNSERGLAMALKGLPETPPQEILEELKNKGLNPLTCIPITNSGNSKQSLFHIYKVTFPPGTAPNTVTKINSVFSTRIYWEKFFSKKNYTQCFRCQPYGHCASNCGLPYKCVKCAGFHSSADCQKPRETPPKCINCAGPYTANYGQCPALLTYLEKRKASPRNSNGVALIPPRHSNLLPLQGKVLPPPPTRTSPTIPAPFPSYADVVVAGARGQQTYLPSPGEYAVTGCPGDNPIQPCGVNAMHELIGAIQELNSIVDINQMLLLTRSLIEKLRPCRSIAEKFQVFCLMLGTLN